MRTKNILKYSFAVLLLITAGSCGKKLDIQPKQSIDAVGALSTPDDVEAAVVGAYSIMAGGALYGTNLFMNADLQAAEGYCSWRGTFQGQRQIAAKNMTRDNTEASRTWIAGYAAINMANTVIDALGVVTDADQKKKLEGEALFIRGIIHFELVRIYALPWGATPTNNHIGVVIKTQATKNEADAFQRIPRSTVAQVYTQVINDLTAAISKLPNDNGTRVDKFVAQAFLARVYLQQGNYAGALAAANAVIASGKYRMNASVRAVFDNKNTPESIWEIQQNEQNNAGTANDGMATFFSSLDGIGRADVRMNANFVNSYDPYDLRMSEWYYVGEGARPGNLYCGKWKSFSMNLPVIRIAEMYLIRAECNLRLSSVVGDLPANDLAEVRNPIRTNLAPIAAPTLNDVLNERIFELAFEGLRIHDVKRLKQTLVNAPPTPSYPWNDNRLVFPIPAREVDATEGVIAQNPGY